MLWKSLKLERLCVDFNAQGRPIRKLNSADNLEAERKVTKNEQMDSDNYIQVDRGI